MVKRKKTKSTDNLEIKDHILVPKHEKCSEAEKKNILHKHNIELKDLPKISINDAGLYNLDLKPGDLVKITRQSSTAGKSIFYRVVIEV
jgi:DNA-directed RNA polymerase subunit H